MKDENPECLFVQCVIHRVNLVSKIMSSDPNVVLKSVINCINVIEGNAKCEGV